MPIDEREKRRRAIISHDDHDMVCCIQALARRYLASFPDDGYIWYLYAVSLRRLARYSEALSALRKAARLYPRRARPLIQSECGRVYQKKGSFRRAEACYRKAIAADPSEASAYTYLGALFALEGRLPEAEAAHRKATHCKKGCIDEAFFNLGLVLRAQERYAGARACFQRALKIDPKYKDAKKALADVVRVIKLNRDALS